MRSSLKFAAGTVFGVYLSQNYKVPDVKKLVIPVISAVKLIEDSNRPPPPPRESGGEE